MYEDACVHVCYLCRRAWVCVVLSCVCLNVYEHVHVCVCVAEPCTCVCLCDQWLIYSFVTVQGAVLWLSLCLHFPSIKWQSSQARLVYIYIYMSAWVSIFLGVFVCLCVNIHVCICVCVCVCEWVSVCVDSEGVYVPAGVLPCGLGQCLEPCHSVGHGGSGSQALLIGSVLHCVIKHLCRFLGYSKGFYAWVDPLQRISPQNTIWS
jgi:hypothetical protein